MSKQDRQGARTVTDLERKYDFSSFGESFAEAMGIANDARKAAEDLGLTLEHEVTRLDEELSLKVSTDDNDQVVAMINASADILTLNANRLVVESDNFSLSEDGTITAKNCNLSGTFKNTGADSSGVNGTLEMKGCEIKSTDEDMFTAYFRAGVLDLEAVDYAGQHYFAELVATGLWFGNLAMCLEGQYGIVGMYMNHDIEFGYENAHLAGTWTSESSISVTSDANKKHDITDITEAYSVVFDNLKPRLYRYNDGKSGRIHVGFVAQEVEEAILAAGLTTQDFAAFVRAEMLNRETGETETVCLLRYEEFIALLAYEIQKLKGVKA